MRLWRGIVTSHSMPLPRDPVKRLPMALPHRRVPLCGHRNGDAGPDGQRRRASAQLGFRTRTADLLRRTVETQHAERLEAADLQERFGRDFRMEQEGCYCLSLERDRRQIASTTSNAAQVLRTGIVRQEHAVKVAGSMVRPDMFSGWGMCTLSADHAAFDFLACQQGNVWPFDNAPIVSSLRCYGEDAAVLHRRRGAGCGGRLPP